MRLVTHRDVTSEQCKQAIGVIAEVAAQAVERYRVTTVDGFGDMLSVTLVTEGIENLVMKKYIYLALGVLLVGTLVKASNQAKPETKTRTLNVKLNYTGAGTVDEKHKIFVFIFDSPDFMQGGAMPIGMMPGLREGRHGYVYRPDQLANLRDGCV